MHSSKILECWLSNPLGNTRITNTDDLLSYLEQHTQPGQTINFTIIRNGQQQTIQVTIGKA